MSDELTCYDKTTCRFAEEVRELRAEVARLRAALKEIDDIYDPYVSVSCARQMAKVAQSALRQPGPAGGEVK